MQFYSLLLMLVPWFAFASSAAIAILGFKKDLAKSVTPLKLLAFLALYSVSFFVICTVTGEIIRHNIPFTR